MVHDHKDVTNKDEYCFVFLSSIIQTACDYLTKWCYITGKYTKVGVTWLRKTKQDNVTPSALHDMETGC